VVSGGSGKFGDPYSTNFPPSSVFDGSLARNGGLETASRAGDMVFGSGPARKEVVRRGVRRGVRREE